jgi:hypothetical protein
MHYDPVSARESTGGVMVIGLRAAPLLLAVLAACAPRTDPGSGTTDGSTTVPDQPPTAVSDTTVHATGFGPVRAGMTPAEAERALGGRLAVLGPPMEPCHYIVVDGAHPGVAFMVIDGRIARVDVERTSTVRTAEGAGNGDSEERIHSLYAGRVEVQPHKYVDGHYLIVRPTAPADSGHRIIFETDGRQVTSYRAGRLPEVRWIEGCS